MSRSRRKPTLSQLDIADFDDYETGQSGRWNKGRGVRLPPFEPSLPLVGGPDCWCGQRSGHDWLGKDQGGPHPRPGKD